MISFRYLTNPFSCHFKKIPFVAEGVFIHFFNDKKTMKLSEISTHKTLTFGRWIFSLRLATLCQDVLRAKKQRRNFLSWWKHFQTFCKRNIDFPISSNVCESQEAGLRRHMCVIEWTFHEAKRSIYTKNQKPNVECRPFVKEFNFVIRNLMKNDDAIKLSQSWVFFEIIIEFRTLNKRRCHICIWKPIRYI